MKTISDEFKSSLFIHLENKPLNDFYLDSTHEILSFENSFALNGKILVEYTKDKLLLSRIKPFSKIGETVCLEKIKAMIFIREYFVYATDDFLCLCTDKTTRKIPGDFKDLFLVKIGSLLGLQFPKRLVLFDLETKKEVKEIKSSLSFYSHNLLLTSFDFLLTIYINLEKKLEINLPDIPTCFTTDLLFTRIYCGQKTGDILCINLDGSENRNLFYHKSKIISVKFSFCQRFLYSADSNGLVCVWDVKHNVVIDKIETGCEIFGLEVALGDCATNEISIPKIFKS